MKTLIKSILRKNPRVFDLAKGCHTLFSKKDAAWHFFDSFSKVHDEHVSFLYIGANDGIRSDPIRYFIVRDEWQGILVEPLPDVFSALKLNFDYLNKSNLVFVNAAISSGNSSNLSFWTFDDHFLDTLTMDEKINYLRKSSFDRSHVVRCLNEDKLSENVLKEIKVPSLSVSELIRSCWKGPAINLLVMDAEGHEAAIIPSLDFSVIKPEAIYFESHNLGVQKSDVYSFLTRHGYGIRDIVGDSIAWLKSSEFELTPDFRMKRKSWITKN